MPPPPRAPFDVPILRCTELEWLDSSHVGGVRTPRTEGKLMSTNLASVGPSETPEEAEGTPPTPRRSRWVGILVIVAIVLLCGLGVVLFERQILTQRVASLQAQLEASQREAGATAADLSREILRGDGLRSTMGEINEVSADLVQKLTSLQVLTSEALSTSSRGDEAPIEIVDAPAPEDVVEAVEVAETVEAGAESQDVILEESPVEARSPTRDERRGAPTIGVLRPFAPEFE